jgi:hypothetical protein
MEMTSFDFLRNSVLPHQFARIARWNLHRNELYYNFKLEEQLVLEEVAEYWHAEKTVDKLDAYLDVLFVLCGTVAKLSTPKRVEEEGTMVYKAQSYDVFSSWGLHPSMLVVTFHDLDMIARDLMGTLYLENIEYDLIPSLLIEGLDVVIEANEQKLAEKDKNGKIKKPEGFKPPEETLKKLIKEYQKRSEDFRAEREQAQAGQLPTLTSGQVVG